MSAVRNSMIELIDLLAHPDKQRQYEKDVPIAHVPSELICMFCDDIYHPESEQMRSQFTVDELKGLIPLNDFICEASALGIGNLVELLAHPKWKQVVAEAEKLNAYYQSLKNRQISN